MKNLNTITNNDDKNNYDRASANSKSDDSNSVDDIEEA